jgi:hypothetical protein
MPSPYATRERELSDNLARAFEIISRLESALLVAQDPSLAAHYREEIVRLQEQAQSLTKELQEVNRYNNGSKATDSLTASNYRDLLRALPTEYPVQTVQQNVRNTLPYAGCKLYFSGPGDQYAYLAELNEDTKPREIVNLRETMIEGLVKSGFSVVRDRNLPEYQRPFDPGKVRYLIATCDGFCAFCYPKELDETTQTYRTSAMIIEEISYALEINLPYIVVFVEETVKDPMLERLLSENSGRIKRRRISTAALKNPGHLWEQLFQPWELIRPQDHSVFVTIPFAKQYDGIFEAVREVVREVCNLDCKRSIDTAVGTASEDVEVYRAIINKIQKTPFVVLVLFENHPNCYFEAGVAAAYNRPAIRIASEEDELPFNVQHWSAILTQPDSQGQVKLLTDLKRELSRFAREEVSQYNPTV